MNLAEPLTFTGGEHYWISIQGIGSLQPQSMVVMSIPFVKHCAVQKSKYLGLDDWTDTTDTFGFPSDFHFQLIGEGNPPIPDLEGGGNLEFKDVQPGSIVDGTVTIRNTGDAGSMLEWKVLSVPEDWGENWMLRWQWMGYNADTEGGLVGTTNPEIIFIEVQVPDDMNQEFSGDVVLVNVENPDDTCTINVVCTTPKTKSIDIYFEFINRIIERFPVLQSLL